MMRQKNLLRDRNNNKHSTNSMKTFIALFVLLAGNLNTQAAPYDLVVDGTAGMYSQYVNQDGGLRIYNDPVFQGNFTLTHQPTGVFLDLWYSTDTGADRYGAHGNELDYTIGWRGNVSKDMNLTASLSYQDTLDDSARNSRDAIKGNLRLEMASFSLWVFTVAPFANYATYIPTDTNLDGGNIYSAGVNTELVLSPMFDIASSGSIGWDDGVYGVEPGGIFKYASSLNCTFSEQFTWNILKSTLYIPIGNRRMDVESVYGTGISFKF